MRPRIRHRAAAKILDALSNRDTKTSKGPERYLSNLVAICDGFSNYARLLQGWQKSDRISTPKFAKRLMEFPSRQADLVRAVEKASPHTASGKPDPAWADVYAAAKVMTLRDMVRQLCNCEQLCEEIDYGHGILRFRSPIISIGRRRNGSNPLTAGGWLHRRYDVEIPVAAFGKDEGFCDIHIFDADNEHPGGNPHPHIDAGGRPCWGDFAHSPRVFVQSGQVLDLVIFLMQYLQGYNPSTAFCGLSHVRRPFYTLDGHYPFADEARHAPVWSPGSPGVDRTPAAPQRDAEDIDDDDSEDEYAGCDRCGSTVLLDRALGLDGGLYCESCYDDILNGSDEGYEDEDEYEDDYVEL